MLTCLPGDRFSPCKGEISSASTRADLLSKNEEMILFSYKCARFRFSVFYTALSGAYVICHRSYPLSILFLSNIYPSEKLMQNRSE